MADMSLEDVIKERKISLNVNNTGNFRGNNLRRVTTTSNRIGSSRPLMVVTGLGKVKVDARLRLQPKTNTTVDSRSTQKIQTYRDARYKLNEIARKTDARIKIEAKRTSIGSNKAFVSRQTSVKPSQVTRTVGSRTSKRGLIVRTADGGLITKKNVVTQTKGTNIIRTSKGLLKTINASDIPQRTIGLSSRTQNSDIFTRRVASHSEKRTQSSSSGTNRGFFITTNNSQKRQPIEYEDDDDDNAFDPQIISKMKREISSDEDELDLSTTTPIKKRIALSSHESYAYDDSSHSQMSTSFADNLDATPPYSIFNAATTTSVLSSPEISRSDINIVSRRFPSHRFSEPEDDDSTVFSPLQGYKVSITNLDQFVTEEDIVELFGEIGPLKRACLTRPGMAEVVYTQKGDAVRAVKEYDNRELDGRPMQCRLVNPERLEYIPETITLQSGRSLGLPRESSSLSVDKQSKSFSLPGSTSSKGLDNFDITVIHRALFKTAVPGPVRPVKFTVKV